MLKKIKFHAKTLSLSFMLAPVALAETYVCSFNVDTGVARTTVYKRTSPTTFSMPQYSNMKKEVFKETEDAIWFFEATEYSGSPGYNLTMIDKRKGGYLNDTFKLRRPDEYADRGSCEAIED